VSKARSKTKPAARKLTPAVVALNLRVAQAIRDQRTFCPPLAMVAFDELLYPEQKALVFTKDKRREMLESHPNHWTTKLTLKLDRLTFPELTQGEKHLSEGKRLARLIVYKNAVCPEGTFQGLKTGLVGVKISQMLLDAAWQFNDRFFKDFAKALGSKSRDAISVYVFLLRNRALVEKCRRVSEIQKLPGIPKYATTSFCRLCRGIGLPVTC
jgi:hypothetical protein